MALTPPRLSVILATDAASAADAGRSLASLDQPGLEGVLVIASASPMHLDTLPPGCRIVQMGPTDRSTAMNRGMNAATGDWITWLSPGETLLPHAAGLIGRALQSDADLIALTKTGAAPAGLDECQTPRAMLHRLWCLPTETVRFVLPNARIKAQNLHFPHGFAHGDLFYERLALMLSARPKAIGQPLLLGTGPAPVTAPDLLAMMRLLARLWPQAPLFADPDIRRTALAAIFDPALAWRQTLASDRQTALDTVVTDIVRGLDPRLIRSVWAAPDLPENLQQSLNWLRQEAISPPPGTAPRRFGT